MDAPPLPAATIMATRLPQTPTGLLGELLADADLDALGWNWEDFWEANHRYRLELESQGIHYTDKEWYRSQLEVLESHIYFTPVARTLRAVTKRKNVERLTDLLRQTTGSQA